MTTLEKIKEMVVASGDNNYKFFEDEDEDLWDYGIPLARPYPSDNDEWFVCAIKHEGDTWLAQVTSADESIKDSVSLDDLNESVLSEIYNRMVFIEVEASLDEDELDEILTKEDDETEP